MNPLNDKRYYDAFIPNKKRARYYIKVDTWLDRLVRRLGFKEFS